MSELALICQDEQRRHAVRGAKLNGLDYVELSDFQTTLTVYFLGKTPEQISKENVRIEGGQRIRDIRVLDLQVHRQDDPELDDCMTVTVDRPGDFSIYTLCVVEADERGRGIVEGEPRERPKYRTLHGFDSRYACLEFSFKAGCPSDLDCKAETICPPEPRDEPEMNYLAKDYASFRQLILDRLALIMPEWKERHVPDLGIALVELLAYVGDYLSYYQDAVATEASLDTARQRISVRRHARLVDYLMHEGCNARAWVCVETHTDIPIDPQVPLYAKEIYFITRHDDAQAAGRPLTTEDLRNIPSSRYEVFEPLVEHPENPIHFHKAHNRIHFYTWGDRDCCLPRRATRATLKDGSAKVVPAPDSKQTAPQRPEKQPAQESESVIYTYERELHLKPGDFLLFEEVIGPKTGNPADADPAHRHVVRLTRVEPGVDPLNHQPIVEIEWAQEDALPFPLCLSATLPAPKCEYIPEISVACGNVLLVDHGRTIEPPEALGTVKRKTTIGECKCEGSVIEVTYLPDKFQPLLKQTPLTFSQPVAPGCAASTLLVQDPRLALPQIKLSRIDELNQLLEQWTPRPDLLGSASWDRHFIVETDNDRRAHLRFGDGELGRRPEAGMEFKATYRVGNGPAGNVGADAIAHIVFRHAALSGATIRPRNPLPARGGTDPEPLPEVKLFAPGSFRKRLERAITAEDYAELAMRDFKERVQWAAAELRWTGSWYEARVAVDPLGAEEASQELLDRIERRLHRYRRIGHDLSVTQARYVPLDIEMTVCVLPHYLRGHVKAALLETFSNRALSDGRRGFFHPDSLTFGEGIFLSKLVAAAQAVTGVESVIVTKLARFGEGPNRELETGLLPLGPLEIAQLDNDPSFPEHGKLTLNVKGGR